MNLEKIIFKTHKLAMKGYARALLSYDLLMEAPLPAGPKILAANHPTTTDPFLLPLLVNEPIFIFVTGMAFEVPVLGALLERGGHIRVDNNLESRLHTLQQAVERLARGGNIGIFPEGSLSPEPGAFCRPRSGAARIAMQSGAPVIPVGIHHSPDACYTRQVSTESYQQTARWVVRGDYFLSVGQPLHFSGDTESNREVRRVSAQIMEAIQAQARLSQERMASPQMKWSPLLPRLQRGESY